MGEICRTCKENKSMKLLVVIFQEEIRALSVNGVIILKCV